LKLAVAACSRLSRPGDAVLLSPACASFDQFSDFQDRGASFKALVEDLA
jgi:UDP-N-acetylmuramoylalanine--D-glutamate ligase